MSEPAEPEEPAGTAPHDPAGRSRQGTVAAPPVPAEPGPAVSVEVRVAAVVTAALAALGLPVAALWYVVAPHAVYRIGTGGGAPADLETKAFIADDGWFLFLTAVVGIAVGIAAYLLGRRYSVGLAVALAVGGLAGAVVAWKTGEWFGSAGFSHALRTGRTGSTLHGPLSLRAKGTLVGWPIGSLLAFAIGHAYGTASGAGHPGSAPVPESTP